MFWFYLLWRLCIRTWAWSFTNVHTRIYWNPTELFWFWSSVNTEFKHARNTHGKLFLLQKFSSNKWQITDDKLFSQLNVENVLPGHIIVQAVPVGFVGPAKNILIHMTNIGKQFPKPTISILEYFSQSTKIAKNMLELPLIKVTSRNYWLKGTLFVR